MNIKISHYILLSFLVILILFSATTLINYRLSEAVNANERYLSRSTDIIRNTGRFQRNMLSMVSGLRGYLLTGEISFVEAYDVADKDNEVILQELSSLVSAQSQKNLLVDIKKLNKKWTEEYTEPLRTAKMLSSKSDSNLNELNKLYKEKYANGAEKELQELLQERFKAFSNYEYNLREERVGILAKSVKDTRRASFSLTILSIIISSVVVGFLIKRISSRILNMTQMANSIAAGNYDVNVVDAGSDELSSLGHSLNHMASELSKKHFIVKKIECRT